MTQSHKLSRLPFIGALVLLAPLLVVGGGRSLAQAQGDSRLFPETGKTVSGRFLQYWNDHGGLTQQGFPISEEMLETSDTNGKTYTVQYFERAVFEAHPDNAAPNDVLLSLLGVFLYNQKYPLGATGQTPSSDPNARLFTQTGHKVGGIFLEYWTKHGGLAQQGYPISEEFQESSALDNKIYTVQYFERAVFESHPENQPPYNVLLSQLGTFRFRDIYRAGTPTVPAPTGTVLPALTTTVVPSFTPAPSTPTSASTPTAVATATAIKPAGSPTVTPSATTTPDPCAGIPANQNMVVGPSSCAKSGALFYFVGHGFSAGEFVGVYLTGPDGKVFGTTSQVSSDANGIVGTIAIQTQAQFPVGVWALTMESVTTHQKAIGYFRLLAP